MTTPDEALIAELRTLCDTSLVSGIPHTARRAMLRAAEALSRPTVPDREGIIEERARAAEIERVKSRHYECFMEDHEPQRWSPGRCAGYAGRGSLVLHLFRCKRRDGHGLGGLFCVQHSKTGGF